MKNSCCRPLWSPVHNVPWSALYDRIIFAAVPAMGSPAHSGRRVPVGGVADCTGSGTHNGGGRGGNEGVWIQVETGSRPIREYPAVPVHSAFPPWWAVLI